MDAVGIDRIFIRYGVDDVSPPAEHNGDGGTVLDQYNGPPPSKTNNRSMDYACLQSTTTTAADVGFGPA